MKKLLFSLIAISLFSFATAAGTSTSIRVVNNSGLDIKVLIGARKQTKPPGEVQYHDVVAILNGNVVAKTATGVHNSADFISRLIIAEMDGVESDHININVDSCGTGTFVFNGETYGVSFTRNGAEIVYTITKL